MAFRPVTNGVEVEFRWTLFGVLCENRIFVRTDAPPTLEDMAAIGDIASDWVTGQYAVVAPSQVQFTTIQLTDMSTEGGQELTVPINAPGTSSGVILANEVSFCVKLTTGFSGRSKRGRWYMPPPITSSLVDANHLTTTVGNAYAACMQALLVAMNAAGFRPGVASRTHAGVPVNPITILAYTTASYTDTTLDSQRQRRPGNGS